MNFTIKHLLPFDLHFVGSDYHFSLGTLFLNHLVFDVSQRHRFFGRGLLLGGYQWVI